MSCTSISVNIMFLDSYEAFCNYVDDLNNENEKIVFYFSGEKLASGVSWCSDCVEAEPIVNAYLSQCKENVTFVKVNVGNREYWKDMACPFRTDSRLRLMVIPTLIRWGGVKRLEGSQCNNKDLIDMLFEDEE